MRLNKRKTLSILLVITCVLVNSYSIVCAQSNTADTPKEISETQDISTIDDHNGYSTGVINTPIDTNLSGLKSDESAESMAAYEPVGVVITSVHTIGSGLVDLDTEMSATMGITSVYGSMWYDSTAGKRTASLYRPNNGNVPWYEESVQFHETPGTVIWSCGSSGVVIFNFSYSYSFYSVPSNFLAIVY